MKVSKSSPQTDFNHFKCGEQQVAEFTIELIDAINFVKRQLFNKSLIFLHERIEVCR